MSLFAFLTGGAAAAALVEIGARMYHRRRFLVPFHSRAIGEYPYDGFLEMVDSPLHFTFRKNFKSSMLSLNRFGARGPEPAADGSCRRVLALGESNLFGAKLKRQEDLWSMRLEDMLRADGRGGWEVINASIPGYNTFQYLSRYEELIDQVRPQILLLSIGGNDISQAFVMGKGWQVGAPWPDAFIKALQRKSSLTQKLGAHSCLYFLRRRQAATSLKGFTGVAAETDWSTCLENNFSVTRRIIDDARKRGIKVALTGIGPAYSLRPTPSDERKLDAIQANWRENLTGAGVRIVKYFQNLTGEFAEETGVMGIDLTRPFWEHPQRFEMFHDVFHWNPAGHRLVAEIFYRRFDDAGLWN